MPDAEVLAEDKAEKQRGESHYIEWRDRKLWTRKGFTVERCVGHHGEAGYAVAWRRT